MDEQIVRVLHFGAGVQSSTIAEMMVEGHLPPVELVIFADTRCEPVWVYEQVEYAAGRLAKVGVPLVVVSAGDLYADSMSHTQDGRLASLPVWTYNASRPDGKRVGRLRRQCTREYKIKPAHDMILEHLLERGFAKRARNGARRVKRGITVESWMGLSYDELVRIRRPKRTPNWVKHVYPLILPLRMTRERCYAWLEARNLPIPKKSSCSVCPFHDDSYWLYLALHDADAFEAARRFDDRLRDQKRPPRITRDLKNPVYLHPSCRPLREIDFEAEVAAAQVRSRLPMFPQMQAACGAHCMV